MTQGEQRVASTLHDHVVAADLEQWSDEICSGYYLPHIEEAGEPYWTNETASEVYEDYGRKTTVEVQYMVVHWPLKHDIRLMNLLSLRPSISYGSLPEIHYLEGDLQFRLRIGTLTELHQEHVQQAARTKLEETIKNLREEFAARNKDVEKWTPALRHHVAEAVKRRKEQVGQKDTAMQKLAASISIPLRKKSEVPPKVVYLPAVKPAATRGSATTPTSPREDMILDRSGFSTLLNCVERYLRDCERTPRTFAKLEEEEVRNLLLPYLNQLFEGGATGETFSKTGKTDIYLVVQKGCILICECKWWRGPKSVEEMSEQILGRVTWRENFGIALVFVKDKFDDALLERIKQAVKVLRCNKSQQVREANKAHLSANLVLPESVNKTVEVHYLVCNFSG